LVWPNVREVTDVPKTPGSQRFVKGAMMSAQTTPSRNDVRGCRLSGR
jgi:hypothetical protein